MSASTSHYCDKPWLSLWIVFQLWVESLKRTLKVSVCTAGTGTSVMQFGHFCEGIGVYFGSLASPVN